MLEMEVMMKGTHFSVVLCCYQPLLSRSNASRNVDTKHGVGMSIKNSPLKQQGVFCSPLGAAACLCILGLLLSKSLYGWRPGGQAPHTWHESGLARRYLKLKQEKEVKKSTAGRGEQW